MALRDMIRLVYAYQSMRPARSARSHLGNQVTACELIPELMRHDLQQLMELEFAAVLDAERHERSEGSLGYRNGYRPRLLRTQVSNINRRILKLCSGSFLP
jgi:transposase-like protein